MSSGILSQPDADATPPPKRPTRMRISIGGFGCNSSLTYKSKQLKYARDDFQEGNPIEAVVTPSDDDWAAFRNELDALGVWNWAAEYEDRSICDGTQWEVEIKWGRLKCKAYGSNAYPGEDDTLPEDAQPFARFLRAVSRLAGGRTFE